MIYKTKYFVLNSKTLSVKNSKSEEIKIYNKDYEVLLFLCQQNKAISPWELLEAIWDRNEEYSSNVVASSISNIRKVIWSDCIKTIRNNYLIEEVEIIDGKVELNSSILKNISKKKEVIFSLILVALIASFFIYQGYSNYWDISVTQLNLIPIWTNFPKLTNEWLVLKNNTNKLIDMEGYSVSDKIGHTYIFKDIILEANKEIKLVTWKCKDTENQVCWNFIDGKIWDNKDAIYIKDKDKSLIYKYSYDNIK